MNKAALGFRVHSGWTALVAVSLEEGKPIVLSRQRVHLVKIFSYTFRQPYHTAARMEREDARKFVDQVREEAENLAHHSISKVQDELSGLGYRLDRGALLPRGAVGGRQRQVHRVAARGLIPRRLVRAPRGPHPPRGPDARRGDGCRPRLSRPGDRAAPRLKSAVPPPDA